MIDIGIYNINTNEFRLPALNFLKTGKYTSAPKGSREYKEYWDLQEYFCKNGLSVGGVKITGEHYFYLNFCQIVLKRDELNTETTKTRIKQTKILTFPDFWDSDHYYFTESEIAKKEGQHMLVLKPRRRGYQQPNSEMVMCENGFRPMGDIKPGDKVYTPKGTLTEVEAVYPQGKCDVYELHLYDGRKVKCGLEHLWSVICKTTRNQKTQVVSTKQMLEKGLFDKTKAKGKEYKSYKFCLADIEPIQYTKKELKIPPYLLGCLLGDGSIGGKQIRLSSIDPEIFNYCLEGLENDYEWSESEKRTDGSLVLRKTLKYKHRFSNKEEDKIFKNSNMGVNPLVRYLQEYNLQGTNTYTKFIPEDYLTSDFDDRLALLQGWLDTDGYISKNGWDLGGATCSDKLAENIMTLARSLGISCSERIDEAKGTSSKIHRIHLKARYKMFRLKRKLERQQENYNYWKSTPIIAINKLDYQEESTCIQVADKDHLYLTRDFIPTHNTYKNSAKCAYNYTFFRNSTSLIIAEQSNYSENNILMAASYLDFLSKHTDFGKSRIIDKPRSHLESGFNEILPDGKKVISGYRSKILAMTSRNNPEVARGMDANVILFEEAGSFSNLKATYLATLPTVQAGAGVSGIIYLYGTGGDVSAGIVDFQDMFYNPEPYNFRAFDNSWEEGMSNNQIGYFLPDYYSKDGFIDINGNSRTKEALDFINAEVETVKRTSKDVNTVDKLLSENPRTPSEAFIKSSTNILPKAEIQGQINRIKTSSSLSTLGTFGFMEQTEIGVLFKPSTDNKPILNFPYKPGIDGEGCVIQYQPPYKFGNVTPPELYTIWVDPYAMDKDKAKELTKRDSLGAAYVYKRVNNFSKPFDMIVCEYVARPKFQDDFNRQLFLLAEYYNAKIVFENDRDGNIISYARTNKLLHRLEEELTVYDSSDTPRKKLGRNYGVSMSNLEVKKQAVQYLRDSLLTPRDANEQGEIELNVHKIYSVPLLEELLKFSYDGNFDRVSAMLVGMLYKKELLLKPQVTQREISVYDDPFFTDLKNKFGL